MIKAKVLFLSISLVALAFGEQLEQNSKGGGVDILLKK